MNVDELVQVVLKEVMSQINNKSINRSGKKAVIFFTGTTINLEESITEIRKLKDHGVNMKAVLSEAASNIIDMNIINDIFSKENVYIDGKHKDGKSIYEEEFDLLIGANLSINSLSKVSNGIGDTLPTALILKCILNGTKIVISKDAVDLGNFNISKNIPIAYMNMIKGYLYRLESYDIKLVNSKDLFNYSMNNSVEDKILTEIKTEDDLVSKVKSIESKDKSLEFILNKKVISKEDISSNSGNKKIVVPSHSIITALARDLADEIGIQIIKR